MIQATEAIKVLTGIGKTLVGRFLRYDARRLQGAILSSANSSTETPLA